MPELAEGLSCDCGVRLLLTHHGPTTSNREGWRRCRAKGWVLDYLYHGWQQQRLEPIGEFRRQSGIAALYAPGTIYGEFRDPTVQYDEGWVVFEADDATASELHHLTGDMGWCHLRDCEGGIGLLLGELGEWMHERPPGFRYRVAGLVGELLTLLITSQLSGQRQRTVHALASRQRPAGLVGDTEHYIREHLHLPLQVADLARQAGLGESAFAHRYPEEAGETPYKTILRLKLSEAKRLLLREHLSVKETAYALGFSNEFNFSRAFKRVEGLSPSAYVRAMQAKQR